MDLQTRLEIVKFYYANNNSPTLCLRAYNKKFGLKNNICSEASVRKLIKKFEDTYSLHDAPKSGRPSVIDDDKVEQVRLSLEEQSNNNFAGISSVRETSRTTGLFSRKNNCQGKPSIQAIQAQVCATTLRRR